MVMPLDILLKYKYLLLLDKPHPIHTLLQIKLQLQMR